MYSTRPGLVLDFHGCDETLVDVVIGAVINLGFCLDLLDYLNLSFLKETHSLFIASNTFLGTDMLVNKTIGTNKDLVLQELACAVIETLHQFRLEH